MGVASVAALPGRWSCRGSRSGQRQTQRRRWTRRPRRTRPGHRR